jgi:hypothetical protein
MGKKGFSLLWKIQTRSGVHLASYLKVTGDFTPGWRGRYSSRDMNPISQPPFSVEFNEWSYTPRPPICLYDMHRGNYNVTFHIEFE